MAFVPANSYSGQIDQHSWLTGLDIVMPENAPKMIDAYGNDPYYNELMFWKMQGVRRIVNNSDGWAWWDELPFNEKVVVKADASSSTTTLSFTINTTYINTLGGQRSIYPRVGDRIIDMGPTVNRGRINSVTDNGTDFTIVAVSSQGTNWTTPTAGKEYAIYTYAEGEDAQTLPDPKDSYTEKQSAKLQRFAEQVKTTADVLTDNLWIKMDENGNAIGQWGDKQVIDCERRMAVQQVGAMILGKYTTTTGQAMTTQGMWDAYSTDSTLVNYTAGSPTLAQQRSVIDSMKANGVFGPIMNMLPKTTYRAFQPLYVSQAAVTDLNVNQAVAHSEQLIFENVPQDGNGLLRRFDVNTAILDGVTLNNRQLNISYDSNRVFGIDAANNKFLTAGFCAPTVRVKDGNNNPVGIIEVGYKSLGKYNLIGNYGTLGWLADGRPTDEQNNRRFGMRSFMGFGFRALSQTVYLQVP
jgi:uncharacterized protein YuzE